MYLKFQATRSAIEKDISNFSVENKEYSTFQRFLCKILFFINYKHLWTTIYPKVWRPVDASLDRQYDYTVLQHEWVHLKDMKNFFGLLPKKLHKFNAILFYLLYLTPQILSILSLFAIWSSLWWLFCLIFLLPVPSPFRYYAELRAYRRSVELSDSKEREINYIINSLSGASYYFCMPFKVLMSKQLSKKSPYKDEMDKVLVLK